MNLTGYEQGVVINFNVGEEMAAVHSAAPAWIRKMDALVREFPDVFRIKRRTKAKTLNSVERISKLKPPCQLRAQHCCGVKRSDGL